MEIGQKVRLSEALNVEIAGKETKSVFWTTPGPHINLSEKEKQKIADWFSSFSELGFGYTLGLHVFSIEEKQQGNADVLSRFSETYVIIWEKENMYSLGFCIDGVPAYPIEVKVTLEQVKKRAPEIFDLEGTLIHL